ncbi:helix-turn-helix transcriptional regulator [Actinomadura litoris]
MDVMTVRELASELHVARSTVYRWLETGRGPKAFRLPNRELRIKRADFIEWFHKLGAGREIR